MKSWLDKTGAKVTFFCLLVLFTMLFLACGLGIVYLIEEGVYHAASEEKMMRLLAQVRKKVPNAQLRGGEIL